MNRRVQIVLWLVPLVFFVVLPLITGRVTTNKFAMILYLAVVVLSLILLTGLNHQISLGHSAFVGIGAYATVILSGTHGWPLWLSIPLGGLCSFVVGVIVGLPALRLRAHYLALVTLGISVIFPQILNRFSSVTGGTSGLKLKRRLVAPGWTGLANEEWSYYILLVIAVLMFVLTRNLIVSRVGRALRASAHETAARSVGIDVARYRVMTFGVSGAIAGIGGGMFALHNQFVSSVDFGLMQALDLLTAMVVGGVLIGGAVIGSVFLQYGPEVTKWLGVTPSLNPIVYGIVLLACVYVFRDGVSGGVVRAARALRKRCALQDQTAGERSGVLQIEE